MARLVHFSILVLLLALPHIAWGQQLAFPTAEGFGRFSQGGRGGKAYNINSLSSGSGSGGSCNAGGCTGGTITFRDCLADRFAVGARTCIFKVGGVIDYGQAENPWTTPNFITIAGQTAPGNGIIIRGLDMPLAAQHIIVRHIRMRNRPYASNDGSMGLLELTGTQDAIFDHLSMGWHADDAGWCSYSGADRCTLQWSLVTEGVAESAPGDYNKFGLVSTTNNVGPTFGGHSFLHNFIAQVQNRVPWQQGSSVQWINNLVYNVGDASAIFPNDFAGQAPKADWEQNYYKTGPQQTDGNRVNLALASSCYPPAAGCPQQGVDYAAASQIYLSGNIQNLTRPNNTYPEDAFIVRWYTGEPLKIVTTKPSFFPTIPSMIQAVDVISDAHLAKIGAYAGLAQGRDTIDTRGINSFKNNTGGTLACATSTANCCSDGLCGETGTYNNGTAYTDTDGDGMSDAYETAHSLNPNNASDGPALAAGQPAGGYTNLEMFLNEMAGDITPSLAPSLNITTGSGSTTATSVLFQGTANDDVGVTSMGASCVPSCGTPTVTCTPTCGASASAVSWSVTIPLTLGSNVVTITANDGVPQSTSDNRTITRLVPIVTNQQRPFGRMP